jgi:hypothetical protein
VETPRWEWLLQSKTIRLLSCLSTSLYFFAHNPTAFVFDPPTAFAFDPPTMSSRITHQETCWVRQGATLGCYACRKANAGHQHVFVRCIYAYVDNLRNGEGLKKYWEEMNAAHARGEVFTKQYVRPPPPLELTKEEIKEWKKRRAAERKETTTEKATAGLKRKKSKKESDSDDADSEVDQWDQDLIVSKQLPPTVKSNKIALQEKLAGAKKKLEKAKADKEKADKELADKEQANKEKADKEKDDKEQADKEQADKEKADKEKADKEQADKEKADKEEKEKEHTDKGLPADKRVSFDLKTKEQADKEQADKEQADKEQADKEKADKEEKEKEHTNKGLPADKRVSFDLKTKIVTATVARPRRSGAKYGNEANTAEESKEDAAKKSKLQTIGENFRKRSGSKRRGSTILHMSALKKRMDEAKTK